MRNGFLRTMVAFAATIVFISSADARVVRTLDSGWKFALTGDNAASSDFDDAAWQQVRIPHTWNALDAFDDVEGFNRTTGWYRRKLHISDIADRNYTLRVGAANQYAEVYVNGELAITHIGGYLAFSEEITSLLHAGENVLAIKVDNSHNPDIPPLSADFTFYGGIYRDVELIETSPVHVSTTFYASKGLFVRTPQVSAEKALVDVEVKFSSSVKARSEVLVELVDDNGTAVASLKKKVKLPEGIENLSQSFSFELQNPHLWDVEDPYLYTARVSLFLDGKVVDSISDRFGVRSYSFTPESGLVLNGRRVKLSGTNRHQDYHGLGNALPDAIHVADMERLKNMGGNFLRVSHYPQHERVMEACDRLGIVTSVEIPLINAITMSEEFIANSLTMAQEMLWQNFNSPSVLIWAYMNEIQLRHPSEDKEWLKNTYYPAIVALAEKIDDRLHELDPARYTMVACDYSHRYYDSGLVKVPQIVGWNIYTGWYGRNIERFAVNLQDIHRNLPNKVLIISEYGADADIRLHSQAPERFDYTLDYSQLFHEFYFTKILKTDFIAGSSLWNLNDFGSESRGDAVPHTNLKGVTTTDRVPKDVYYFYQAKLLKTPVVHVCNYTWTKRAGAETSEGVSLQKVKVYTNQHEVELFLNGTSLGVKPVDNCFAVFEVPFVDGKNALEAKAGGVKDGYICDFDLISQKAPAELNVLLGTGRYFEEPRTGVTWIPEQEYKDGSWGFVGGEVNRQKTRFGSQPASAANILGTDCDPMYQTQRIGLEAFKADMPAGNYSVYLHFAELAGKVKASVYNLGNEAISNDGEVRVFDVMINGVTVLDDFDIASEVGVYAPLVERFEVDVKGNEGIVVEFRPRKGSPVLNAISIRKNY